MPNSEKIEFQVAQLRGLCDTIKPCLDQISTYSTKGEIKSHVEQAIKDLEKILRTMDFPARETATSNNSNGINNTLKDTGILYKMVENSPQGQILVSEDVIQYINKSALNQLGYSDLKELEGKKFSSLIYPKGDISINSINENSPILKILATSNRENFVAKLTITPLDESGAYLVSIDEVSQEALVGSVAGVDKLEYLLQESPAAIYSAQHVFPYSVSYMSDNIEKITGYSAKDYVENSTFWTNHIHPNDAIHVYENFDHVFHNGNNQLEYRFLFSDNTYHWMQDNFRLTYDIQNNVNGIVGCWIDITEKKETELKLIELQKDTETVNEELQASQEELIQNLENTIELNKRLEENERFIHRVISSIKEGVFVLDKELKFTLWNQFLEKLTGVSQGSLLGKHPMDVFLDFYLKHPDRTSFLERALSGETIKYNDFLFQFKDVPPFWAQGVFTPLLNSNNEIIGVIGTVSDITEQKLARAAVIEQKNLLQAFYDTATFHMGVFEVVENDFIFRLPNKKITYQLKKSPEEVQGKRASELGISKQIIREWYKLFTKCISTGATMQKEETYRKSNGQKTVLLYTFAPIDEKSISLIALDITSRKVVEEENNQLLIESYELNKKLQLSRKSLLEAQKLARMGIWELDLQTQKVEWSDVMFELFGLSSNEPVPPLGSFLELIDPECRELVQKCTAEVIELGKEYSKEIKILPKDVPYRWISSIGRPVFGNTQKIVKVEGIYFDITAQKNASEKIKQLLSDAQESNNRLLSSEEELKQSLENSLLLNERLYDSEQRWQFSLEGNGEGVWDWNPQTDRIFYSTRMKEIMGYDPDEDIDDLIHWELKLHPEDKGYVMASLSNCLNKITDLYQTEYRIRGKNNIYFWVLARGKILEWNNEGKPTRMVGTVVDITERKQNEVKLANSANYLNKIINTIIDPVFVKDRNHRLILVNDACCHFAGLKREQLLGKTDFNLLTNEKAEILWEIDEKIFKYGEDHVREDIITLPDGKKYTILTKKSLYVDSGGDCLLVGILIDITELKILEHKLKEQNENLKKVNTELDSFVYRTSHDLRSPLASVLGLINICRNEREEKTRQTYMDLMEKSISKLDTFIHDIINFSRNTRIDIIEEKINLYVMIEEILEGLKYMDGYERIEKRVEIIQSIPFVSDSFRLKIICNNLISNAIKYSSPIVLNPYISIKVIVTVLEATFEIKDNGLGIAKENISKVFNMFFRASTASKGSGLGLYIVKEVIQRLKGSIAIESEIGSGTSFKVVIPNKLNSLQPD